MKLSQGQSSGERYLPGICKALGLIPSIKGQTQSKVETWRPSTRKSQLWVVITVLYHCAEVSDYRTHPLDLAEPATGVNLRPWTRRFCKYCGKGSPRLQGQAVLIPSLQKTPKRRSLRSLQQMEEPREVCCSQLLTALCKLVY